MARTDLALQELSNLLWRERQLLDSLEYRLTTQRLLLGVGDARWLARASEEVAEVLDAIRLAELSRAVAFAGLAADLGMADMPPLRGLLAILPAPWADIFAAHRRALITVADAVRNLAGEVADLLAGATRAADTAATAGTAGTAATPAPADAAATARASWTDCSEPGVLALHLVADQVSARCAMAVSVEALQPTLTDFLA